MKNLFAKFSKFSPEKAPTPEKDMTIDEEYDQVKNTANGIGCFEAEAIKILQKLRITSEESLKNLSKYTD